MRYRRCVLVNASFFAWYLMVPGITAQGEIAANEPVASWEIALDLPTFSLSDCEQLRADIIHHLDASVRPVGDVDDWLKTRNKLREELGAGMLDDGQIRERVRDGVCRWLSDSFDGFDAFD